MLIWQRNCANPWIGMSVGIAAAALLFAACADESPLRSTRRSAPAPAAQAAVTPAATVLPEMVEEAPIAPPTAVEVADAWKEGVALYEGGDYSAAIVPLQIAADGLPDEPYTRYLFGLALWKAGELDSAERALRTASELNPDSIKTWINLARVRLDNDDVQGALMAADAALALDAGSADALHQRGRALAALQRHDDALETLRRAHQIDPDNGYVANTLGYLLLQSDRAGDALPCLEAARDRLPQVAYVRNNLGVAYERNGEMLRAMDEYRAAVAAGDPGGKALASLGRLQPLVETIAAGTAADGPAGGAGVSSEHEEGGDPESSQASLEIEPAGN
jgi:tetratricopeptide (TPR) repeat protein